MYENMYACSACSGTYEDTGEHLPAGGLCPRCQKDGVRFPEPRTASQCTYAVYEEELYQEEAAKDRDFLQMVGFR